MKLSTCLSVSVQVHLSSTEMVVFMQVVFLRHSLSSSAEELVFYKTQRGLSSGQPLGLKWRPLEARACCIGSSHDIPPWKQFLLKRLAKSSEIQTQRAWETEISAILREPESLLEVWIDLYYSFISVCWPFTPYASFKGVYTSTGKA